MIVLKRKVFAYFTHHDYLLVFRHPSEPEVDYHVPGGTVKDVERYVFAVMGKTYEG